MNNNVDTANIPAIGKDTLMFVETFGEDDPIVKLDQYETETLTVRPVSVNGLWGLRVRDKNEDDAQVQAGSIYCRTTLDRDRTGELDLLSRHSGVAVGQNKTLNRIGTQSSSGSFALHEDSTSKDTILTLGNAHSTNNEGRLWSVMQGYSGSNLSMAVTELDISYSASRSQKVIYRFANASNYDGTWTSLPSVLTLIGPDDDSLGNSVAGRIQLDTYLRVSNEGTGETSGGDHEEGDIWTNETNMYVYINGAKYTFNLTAV